MSMMHLPIKASMRRKKSQQGNFIFIKKSFKKKLKMMYQNTTKGCI